MERLTANLVAATWISTLASVAALFMPIELAGRGLMPPAAGATLAAPEAEAPRVWFNRRSGVFHVPGCVYYTTTREGLFITLDEAQRIASPCGHCLAPSRRRQAHDKTRATTSSIRAWLMP